MELLPVRGSAAVAAWLPAAAGAAAGVLGSADGAETTAHENWTADGDGQKCDEPNSGNPDANAVSGFANLGR